MIVTKAVPHTPRLRWHKASDRWTWRSHQGQWSSPEKPLWMPVGFHYRYSAAGWVAVCPHYETGNSALSARERRASLRRLRPGKT